MSLFNRNAEWTWPEGVAVGAIFLAVYPLFGGFILKDIISDMDYPFCKRLTECPPMLYGFCFLTQALSFGLLVTLLDSGAGK